MWSENEYPKFVYDAQLKKFFRLDTAEMENHFMRHVGEAPMPISKEEYERSRGDKSILGEKDQPQWRPIDQFDLKPGVPFWGYEPGPVGVFPCHQGKATGGCFLKYTKATHFMPCEGNYQVPAPPKATADPMGEREAIKAFETTGRPATELGAFLQGWLAAKAKGRE